MTLVADSQLSFDRARRFDQFVRATELPLAGLALVIVPALILEDYAANLRLKQAAVAINWFVWLTFCAEYLVKLALAPHRRQFMNRSWFDVLIIVLSPPFLVPQALQGARAVRAMRLFRLLRFIRAAAVAAMGLRMAGDVLSHRRFHYVALTTGVIVTLGAIGIFTVERGTNQHITNLGWESDSSACLRRRSPASFSTRSVRLHWTNWTADSIASTRLKRSNQ